MRQLQQRVDGEMKAKRHTMTYGAQMHETFRFWFQEGKNPTDVSCQV